jgi:hypothetical protein
VVLHCGSSSFARLTRELPLGVLWLLCVAGTSFARSTAQLSCTHLSLSSYPTFGEQRRRLHRQSDGATPQKRKRKSSKTFTTQLRRNRDIGLYSPVWRPKSNLAAQVQLAVWSLARMVQLAVWSLARMASGGSGRTVTTNQRTSAAVTAYAVLEPIIEAAHRDIAWKSTSPYRKRVSAIHRPPGVQSNTLYHMAPSTWQNFV